MLTQIINARILTPQGWLKDGSVLIRDNKILEVTNCDLAIVGATLIDAKGMYIVPGGVEIHVHGGCGRDFMEGSEDAFRTAVKAHMQHGTTSIFPTLSSSTIPMIRAAAATTEKLMSEPDSPVLGLHLEGHYFNMKMAGGQMPENIKNPDPEEYIPLLEETHCIKRWDAAPELPGAMQFGKYITSKGVLAAVGHTQAEFEDIYTGFYAGYTHATHFYNAMPGFHKRREYKYEGTVESIYLMDDMTVEVVADGIHVPPTILRLVYKIKGVTAKVSVIWNYTFPKGGGDPHFSVMKGSKADLIIRQGKEQGYKPELYIEVLPDIDLAAYEKELAAAMSTVADKYPGVALDKVSDNVWQVQIPATYRVGHEAHFGQVMENYLQYLQDGKLPDWEVPNMIAKYYVTTHALEMAKVKAKK